MADVARKNPDVREWRADAPSWGRELWVEDPSGVEFGFRLGDVAHLAGLRIPADLSDDRLRAALTRGVDEEPWSAQIVGGGAPIDAPVVTPPMQSLAVLGAADLLFGDQPVPAVLAMDRAIAWDELGDRAAAVDAIRDRVFTAVEVTELLLDVGVGDAYRADLKRLLDLAAEAGAPGAQIEALRADLARPYDDEWDYRPDASEYPFRAELRQTATSALLSGEAAARELRDLIHASDKLSDAELVERGRADSWRTTRLKRTVEQLPGRTGSEEDQLVSGEAEPDAINALCRQIGALAIEGSTANPETHPGPAPLLAELVHALIQMRDEIRGALDRAVLRDQTDANH